MYGRRRRYHSMHFDLSARSFEVTVSLAYRHPYSDTGTLLANLLAQRGRRSYAGAGSSSASSIETVKPAL